MAKRRADEAEQKLPDESAVVFTPKSVYEGGREITTPPSPMRPDVLLRDVEAASRAVKQVGGTHYGAPGAVQHWDVCTKYEVPYLEGCASKYLSRWREKSGLVDLRKALSYVQKRLEMSQHTPYPGPRTVPIRVAMSAFPRPAMAEPWERLVMLALMRQAPIEEMRLYADILGHQISILENLPDAAPTDRRLT